MLTNEDKSPLIVYIGIIDKLSARTRLLRYLAQHRTDVDQELACWSGGQTRNSLRGPDLVLSIASLSENSCIFISDGFIESFWELDGRFEERRDNEYSRQTPRCGGCQ